MNKKNSFLFNFLKQSNTFFDMEKFKSISAIFFIIFEKTIVNLDKFLPIYMRFYEKMVTDERKIANISQEKKLLHIGSGPIPATLIIISKKTNADTTGVDINKQSVQKSKKFLKKHYPSLNVKIINKDGADLDFKHYDVILISDGVSNINQILKNIYKSVNKKTQIIFRKTIRDKENFSFNEEFLNKNFKIKKIKTHSSYGNLSSVFLSKK